tara:strand:- start:13354 stop:14829 length:1476 start_codon:yes stop_codon:yes gene_type:complete
MTACGFSKNKGKEFDVKTLLTNPSIIGNEAPFQHIERYTPESFLMSFLGVGYEYLQFALECGIEAYFVLLPEATYSCQEKIQLYSDYNCTIGLKKKKGKVYPSEAWDLQDTVKAVYFRDRVKDGDDPSQAKIYIALVPGKESGTIIDVSSFEEAEVGPFALMKRGDIRWALQLFPAGERPLFGSGAEGCLSPFPPAYYNEEGKHIDTNDILGGIFVDESLVRAAQDGFRITHLDDIMKRDLSLSEKGKQLKNLSQLINGTFYPLSHLIRKSANGGYYELDIFGPVFNNGPNFNEAVNLHPVSRLGYPYDGRDLGIDNLMINFYDQAKTTKFSDMSLSPKVIALDGSMTQEDMFVSPGAKLMARESYNPLQNTHGHSCIDQYIRPEFAAELYHYFNGEKRKVAVVNHGGEKTALIRGPIISGSYQEKITQPNLDENGKPIEDYVRLKHLVFPNHRCSFLMNAHDMVKVLGIQFPGKVHVTPIQYEAKRNYGE